MKTLTLTIAKNIIQYSIWKDNHFAQSGDLTSKHEDHFLARYNLRALLLTYGVTQVVISSNLQSKLSRTLAETCLSEIESSHCFCIHPSRWQPQNSEDRNAISFGQWYLQNAVHQAIKPIALQPYKPTLYLKYRNG